MTVCKNTMGFIEILINLFHVTVTNVPMEGGAEMGVELEAERAWVETDASFDTIKNR